jgi:hypothetical protein
MNSYGVGTRLLLLVLELLAVELLMRLLPAPLARSTLLLLPTATLAARTEALPPPQSVAMPALRCAQLDDPIAALRPLVTPATATAPSPLPALPAAPLLVLLLTAPKDGTTMRVSPLSTSTTLSQRARLAAGPTGIDASAAGAAAACDCADATAAVALRFRPLSGSLSRSQAMLLLLTLCEPQITSTPLTPSLARL